MLGVAPSQDSSDHQDYEPFLIGNPNLNLHLPLEYWEGATPKVYVSSNIFLEKNTHTYC